MGKKLGMGILRMIAVLGGVTILAFVVIQAGTILMPGTKVRKLFGASAETLAGKDDWQPSKGPRTMASMMPGYKPPEQPAQPLAADAGTPGAPDAGTLEAPGR